jgi:hypothetical protein
MRVGVASSTNSQVYNHTPYAENRRRARHARRCRKRSSRLDSVMRRLNKPSEDRAVSIIPHRHFVKDISSAARANLDGHFPYMLL